jgi:hypothetical protein
LPSSWRIHADKKDFQGFSWSILGLESANFFLIFFQDHCVFPEITANPGFWNGKITFARLAMNSTASSG